METKNYLSSYLSNLKRLNKSDHTVKNYRADLSKFFSWIERNEQTKITKINGETIGKYKEFLSGEMPLTVKPSSSKILPITWFKGLFKRSLMINRPPLLISMPLSVSSKRRHLSSLKNFFEYLKESHEDHSKKFSKNPVKSKIHAITLKDIDVIPTTMISSEDFKKIEEQTFRTSERLIIYILYYGGLRLSELCQLKISDFDFGTKTINLNRKGGYMHTLSPIKSDLIFKNLRFLLENLGNNEFNKVYLFQNKKGNPLGAKAMYNKIIKIIERALPNNQISTKITPHSFRKACATELYLKSKDLLFVRDYLNHKDAKVTQTYIDKKTLAQYSRRFQ